MNKKKNYEVLQREFEQIFPLIPGVNLHRIIDIVALDKVTPVLVDYKTSSRAWYNIPSRQGYISAQARGFQAVAYLIPPPDLSPYEDEWDEWAKHIEFWVSIKTGQQNVHSYTYNKTDHQNLLDAAKLIRWSHKHNIFPEKRDYCCGSYNFTCNYQAICYKQPGWQKLYDRKKKKKQQKRKKQK